LRIVPVRPVARAGQVVDFVVTAGVVKAVPGVEPKICVNLPEGLRLTSAPGASVTRSGVCWRLTDLITGRAQSFRFKARVVSVPRSGATFTVAGRMTGANFDPARASAAVLGPPRVTACPSSVRGGPSGGIAC
jgi:hypothetical protein